MCVICFKPRAEKIPSLALLRKMAAANPHGFGFVSETEFFKTLNFHEFYQHLKNVPASENCIIHFRFATHGSVKIENCHPFCCDDIYFAHNGVLPIDSENDMTDSEICLRRYIAPAIKKYGVKGAENTINAHRYTSRFAFMYKNDVFLYGNYIRYKGLFFSNLRFI